VLIMGWVTRAMIKILTISLGINPITAVAICFAATVLYAAAGGLWAVLWTDLVQFVIKMGAVIVLAIYSVRAVGGVDKLKAGVAAHFGSETAALSVMPIQHGPHGFQAYAWMPLLTIGVFIAVQWWASWYPGAEPGGGGYVAQRIFAAKTERDGVLATLLFQVAHYALRPWPWIITALATVILYPNLADKESGYVHAFVDLLPTPWRGVMMAGFAAAYMSTIGTQLNWGASYLVNDFYKRFIRKNGTDKHYVGASRLATIGLFLVALAVTTQLSSIERVQKYLLAIGAGTGLVLILRWYWQRINAWSELSAMIGSLVISTIAMRTILPRFAAGDPNADAWVMVVTVGATTVIWLVVTMLTPKEPAQVLDAFNKRVRPQETRWGVAWANWVAGIVAVYASLFGIGKLIFGETGAGLGFLALAIVAFAWIGRSFRIYSEDTRRSEG
jgi:SSS family solute:Na+ symporter